MASANLDLYDNAVRHAADLRLHEDRLKVELDRIVRRHEKRIDRIAATGSNPVAYTKELTRFKTEVTKFKKGAIGDLIDTEVDFQQNTLFKSVGNVYKVKGAGRTGLKNRLFGSGIQSSKNLEQQVGFITKQQSDRIKAVRGKGLVGSELRAQIKQTAAQTRGQMNSLLTTTITQAETDVLRQTAAENADVIDGLRYTAILDNRTTQICQHHDGNIYKIDDKRFIPPLHWNCRSVLVPTIIPKSKMDASTSKRFIRSGLARLSPKQVGYFDGIPPAVEDYDTWLRRQPFDVQLQHLNGDENRLALFQSGKIKLGSFTNAQGKDVDIDKLRRLNTRAVSQPLLQKKYEPAAGHYFKVEAYTVNDFITDPKARNQLQELFIICLLYTSDAADE